MGWVTIKTYNFGIDATMAQHLLENEGIETHLMDELSIQMNPLYSNALGGVKLQVWEEDVEHAIKVLQLENILQPEDVYRIANKNNTLTTTDNLNNKQHEKDEEVEGSNRPNKPVNKLAIALIVLSMLGIIAFVSYMIQPSLQEKLTDKRWCVNYAIIGTETHHPNSIGLQITDGRCTEYTVFYKSGRMLFPGFDSPFSEGQWTMSNDEITIQLYDSTLQVFNGTYKVNLNEHGATFISPNVSISTTTNR